jgi:hypothetical protein
VQVEPQPPVGEPVIAIGVGRCAPARHLFGQPGQIRQIRAAGGRVEQDLVRIGSHVLG